MQKIIPHRPAEISFFTLLMSSPAEIHVVVFDWGYKLQAAPIPAFILHSRPHFCIPVNVQLNCNKGMSRNQVLFLGEKSGRSGDGLNRRSDNLKLVQMQVLSGPPFHSTMCVATRVLAILRNGGVGARSSILV